ncbi:hypothetical protein J6590_016678 [Homalodisca vitripennis]|nr:hypothetical protein J6590_016678 [Homalodisca vitripennis]
MDELSMTGKKLKRNQEVIWELFKRFDYNLELGIGKKGVGDPVIGSDTVSGDATAVSGRSRDHRHHRRCGVNNKPITRPTATGVETATVFETATADDGDVPLPAGHTVIDD